MSSDEAAETVTDNILCELYGNQKSSSSIPQQVLYNKEDKIIY